MTKPAQNFRKKCVPTYNVSKKYRNIEVDSKVSNTD